MGMSGCGCSGRAGLCFGCALMRACRNGASPVSMASHGGHISCLEALILAKADVLQFHK
jgi:hypothetical protein